MKKHFWRGLIQISKLLRVANPKCKHLIYITQFPIDPQLEKYFRSIISNIFPNLNLNKKLEFFSININHEASVMDGVHSVVKRLALDSRAKLRLKMRLESLRTSEDCLFKMFNQILTPEILELSLYLKTPVQSELLLDSKLYQSIKSTVTKYSFHWVKVSNFKEIRLTAFNMNDQNQYFKTNYESGITSTTKRKMQNKDQKPNNAPKTIKKYIKLRSQSQDIKFIIKNLGEKENVNRNSMYIDKYIKPNHAATLLESNLLQFNKKKNNQVPTDVVDFVSFNMYAQETSLLSGKEFFDFLRKVIEVRWRLCNY
jgi:hypothetical protein